MHFPGIDSWCQLDAAEDWRRPAPVGYGQCLVQTSQQSRCHCSATNSCQNLPRRVGEIINSISSAGPHFTGGGPPHGVPWSRMKCEWCGFWMCGGAAQAPTELLYIVRRQDWIYHHCGSCLSFILCFVFAFLYSSLFLHVFFFCISYFLLLFPSCTITCFIKFIFGRSY